jgi:hypothetical protein
MGIDDGTMLILPPTPPEDAESSEQIFPRGVSIFFLDACQPIYTAVRGNVCDCGLAGHQHPSIACPVACGCCARAVFCLTGLFGQLNRVLLRIARLPTDFYRLV